MMDDDRHDPDRFGDDFWGDTPDWTTSSERPRRQRRSDRPTDITGAIKNLWGSAMSAGASATREHRVLDATTEHPDPILRGRTEARVDAAMFDDLDDDFASGLDDAAELNATTEIPVVDARRRTHADPLVATFANDRDENSERRIDPLLARIGAVAVVTTLMVPLALGLRTGGTSDDTLTTSAGEAPASVAPITPSASSVVDSVAVDPPAAVDPSSLPPAVPANPDPTGPSSSNDSPASDASSSSDAAGAAAAPPETNSAESSTGDAVTAADTEALLAEKVCAIDYIVQSGDYWIGLADGAGVPLAELLEANAATASTPLYPGADICLPAGSATPTTTTPPTTAAPTTAAPSTTPATTVATTAAPTTTPATTSAPPVTSPAGPDDIKQIIRDVWPDDLEEKALLIAYRESRYVPTAKNFCCYGLFQIYWEVHDSWLDDIGITSADQLYDPTTNAQAAYALYQRAGGWGPWSQTNY